MDRDRFSGHDKRSDEKSNLLILPGSYRFFRKGFLPVKKRLFRLMVWVEKFSDSKGRPYFFNTSTGESVWDRPAEMSSSSEEVRASHILVKHVGSRRPSSWRCPTVTLTKEEARAKLQGILDSILNGSKRFEDVASIESDCSSAQQGGDLGFFPRGKMQKPFEDASFALKVGEITRVLVDTDSGLHIIKRVA